MPARLQISRARFSRFAGAPVAGSVLKSATLPLTALFGRPPSAFATNASPETKSS